MADWADEISGELFATYDSGGNYDVTRADVAAALRKAKADGLRMAARMQPHGGLTDMTCKYYERADKIEKGEPND